jgi:hypothetical protein
MIDIFFSRAFLLTILSVTIFGCANPQSSSEEESSRYLLLDSRIISATENAVLVVGSVVKDDANPLFEEDKEWEMRFDNLYGNVIYDEEDQLYTDNQTLISPLHLYA